MSKRHPCLLEHQLRCRACRGPHSSTGHPWVSTGEPWVPPTAGTGCMVVVAAHHTHPLSLGGKRAVTFWKAAESWPKRKRTARHGHFWGLHSASILLSPHIWFQLTGPGRGTEPSSGAAQGWLWGWLLHWWTGFPEQTPNLPLFNAFQCPPLLNQESHQKLQRKCPPQGSQLLSGT